MKVLILSLTLCITIFLNASVKENILNETFWEDTDGQRIEAHGGGFTWVGDTCFWIGEDKSHNQAQFKAVNCYASTDLINWTFRNTLLKAEDLPRDAFPTHLGYVMERPKVIYNDSTQQYVMYVHHDGQNTTEDHLYAKARVAVFQSNKIDGDYTFHSSFKPEGMDSRDMTIFKDDNGKAYLFSSSNGNKDMAIFRLRQDYLSIEKHVSTQWKNGWREAPSVFKHEGVYCLIASGCTGWAPNQGTYALTADIEGTWTDHKNIGNSTTYDSQAYYILPVKGEETTTFIYCGDRWNSSALGQSKYIWLPLKLIGSRPKMDWQSAFTIDVTSGQWKNTEDELAEAQTMPLASFENGYNLQENTIDTALMHPQFDNLNNTQVNTQGITTNPLPNSTVNSTDRCFTVNIEGFNWQKNFVRFYIDGKKRPITISPTNHSYHNGNNMLEGITITEDNRYLHIMHYRSQKNDGNVVVAINHDSLWPEGNVNPRYRFPNIEAGQWIDLVVDLKFYQDSGLKVGLINVLNCMTWGQVGNTYPNYKDYSGTGCFGESVYAYDELVLSDNPLARKSISSSLNKNIHQEKAISSLYPNPCDGSHFWVKDNKDNSTVKIYSLLGTLIKTYPCRNGLITLNHSLAKGHYLAQYNKKTEILIIE